MLWTALYMGYQSLTALKLNVDAVGLRYMIVGGNWSNFILWEVDCQAIAICSRLWAIQRLNVSLSLRITV
jgi:hypothetical protein